jgi:hypothetical protein
MVEAHGNAPVAHGALGVCGGDVGKSLAGLLKPKGVLHGERTVELLLCGGATRNREVDFAQMLGIPGPVIVFLVGYPRDWVQYH